MAEMNDDPTALILARYAPLLASPDPRGERLRRAVVEVLEAGAELVEQDARAVPPPPHVEDLLRDVMRQAWKPPQK